MVKYLLFCEEAKLTDAVACSSGCAAQPDEAKARVYLRLWEVLTGADKSEEFAHLTKADRQAVLEILRDTKPDLPDYWKK